MKNLSLTTKAVFISFLTLLSLACPNLFAQSSRSVAVSNFNGIGVSSGINLYLTQGNKESVVIKGDEDLIKDVEVEQKQESIQIKYKAGVNWNRLFKGKTISVYVTFKNLYALAASGGSDVEMAGTLKTERLSLATSGGSDVTLQLVCKNVSISTSGGSDLKLKGSADNMTLSASGGSDVDAFDFKVNYAKVNSSGGSDINIYVDKGLTANASGGSDIHYKGGAALKRLSSSRSGDITRVND